jgi:hypothetical protein
MLAAVLTITAGGCLLLGLWLLWGKDRTRGPLPTPEEPQIPLLEGAAVPEHVLARFLLPVPGPRFRGSCDCNATRVVWTQDPARPEARLGICRRCGKVRFDVSQGHVLAL